MFAESELCMRLVCGPNREYTMHITDNNGQVGYAAPPGWGQTHFLRFGVGYLFNKPASRKVFQWKLYFCSGGDESSPQLRVLRGMLLVCNRLFLWVWSPNRGSCGKHYRICQTAVRKIYCIHWQFFILFLLLLFRKQFWLYLICGPFSEPQNGSPISEFLTLTGSLYTSSEVLASGSARISARTTLTFR